MAPASIEIRTSYEWKSPIVASEDDPMEAIHSMVTESNKMKQT
jgi:hypothetical protein